MLILVKVNKSLQTKWKELEVENGKFEQKKPKALSTVATVRALLELPIDIHDLLPSID